MLVRVILAAVAISVATVPAVAEPPPFPDFTFKRIKPPKAGAGQRINVQIAPRAASVSAPEAPAPSATGDARAAAGDDWFWAALPQPGPGLGVARMEAGLKALAGGPLVAPRLSDLNAIARRHGSEILRATVGTKVSPAFALAVISVESGGRVDAVSSAGASGLMQLMPATAERFGVADSSVAAENIRGGVKYLHWLLNEFDGDPILALAGYNAGENAVKSRGDVPDYPETRGYVPKVLAAWSVARGLCQTPPMLVSDGCVFVGGGA